MLIYCHAGCQTVDVLAAIKMSMRDLFDDRNGATLRLHRTAAAFTDPQTRSFYQRETPRPDLFDGDLIGDAIIVYIPEGEKDVLAIEAAGGVAVCSAMGAGKADKADWSVLKDKHAIIIADKDEPNKAAAAGRDHAIQVAGLLDGIAASVRIVEAAVGKDAADHIAAGKTLDEFVDAEWCNHGDELPDHESPLETQDDSRPLFPSPTAPLDVARKLYRQYRIGGNGLRTLLAWRGGWMYWEDDALV